MGDRIRPDLSIIVVSFNTREITIRCLASIVTQTRGLVHELIVIDNCSTDGSAAAIASAFSQVRLIRNQVNIGYGPALNVGLMAGTGEFLMILNSDIEFVDNPAKILLDRIRAVPGRVGAIGPQILNPDGTVAPSARRTTLSKTMLAVSVINRHFGIKRLMPERLLREHFSAVFGRWHDNYARHDRPRDAEFVDGMAVLFRRSALEQSGLFDEQIFFGYDIQDLSNRIRAEGWAIEFFPAAKLIHLGHASGKRVRRIIIDIHLSELIYYSKYAPRHLAVLRYSMILSARAKKAMLALRRLVFGDSQRVLEEESIYAAIIQLAKNFKSDQAITRQSIPTLPRQSR